MSNKKKIIQIDNLIKQASDAVFNEPDRGINLCREAHRISVTLKYSKGIANSKLQEGWCLLIKTNYEKSLGALKESLNEFKNLNNNIGEMKELNAFGILYTNISNYKTAMDYYIQSLELSQKTHNFERMGTTYINIGSLYAELEKNDTALDYYKKALRIAKCITNRAYESNCLTSLGKLYQKTNEFTNAETHHSLSLEISESLCDKLNTAECLTNLANLYLAEKKVDKSIEFHKKALQISESINSKYFVSKNYLGLSDAFTTKNDFKNALLNFKLYNNITIELQNDKTNLQLKNINIQKKIEEVKRDAETQRTRNNELQEAYDRVPILNRIGQEIISSLDPEIVMTTIYKNISAFISADLFGIALYNNERKVIEFKYFITDGERLPTEKISVNSEGSMAGWVIKNRQTIHLNDVKNEYLKYVPKLIGTNKNSFMFFEI